MMTDQELAQALLACVAPDDSVLRGLSNSSDAAMAVVDLTSMAVERHVSIQPDLLNEIRAMADGDSLPDEESSALRADLAFLSSPNLNPSR